MHNRSRQRYISLQASITLGMVILGIIVSASMAGLYYYNLSNQALDDIKLRLKNITDITALQLDPQELATITNAADINNESYIKYQKELSDIINTSESEGVINIYTMRRDQKGTIYFYIDTGDPNYVPDPPGVIPYEQPTDLLLATFASPSGTVVENNLYTDEFGTVISAYKPIYNQDGSLESVLGVDMNAETVVTAKQNAIRNIFVYLGISIPVIFLTSLILGYRFSRPAASLSEVATHISHIAEGSLEPITITPAGNKEAFDLIQTFNKMSGDLRNLIQNLEQRVAERTADLEIARQNSENRAKQYESISQVARATTSIQKLEILLRDITKLISEQFGFYHVGIFLVDENREFAVLMAANSKGGMKMLARNHKLKVGQVGMVGYVTGTGNPRIALDAGADAVHFDNPDLPETRSELAMPLRIGGQIIGAVDVQSIETNAFSQDDIQILSTLADQIAIAIQNARSFEESRKLLHEAQSTVSGYMTESWQALRPIQKGLGYQFSENSIKVLESPIEGSHIKDALKKGELIISGENSDNLAIPIRLRGQVIGVMNLQNPAGQAWDQDQIDIATATAERLSLAIENATLLQTTQRRADIEKATSDISTRISSSTRFETILQTTAEELSRALGGSDVLVQIEPVSNEMSATRQ